MILTTLVFAVLFPAMSIAVAFFGSLVVAFVTWSPVDFRRDFGPVTTGEAIRSLVVLGLMGSLCGFLVHLVGTGAIW